MESEILIFPFWPPNQASKSSAEMADLVRGNPWGPVIIFGNSYFLVLSKSIGNLTQKTVGYPSRKGVEHIFSERQRLPPVLSLCRRKTIVISDVR